MPLMGQYAWLRSGKRESRLAGGGFRTLGSLVAGDGFEPTTFGL